MDVLVACLARVRRLGQRRETHRTLQIRMFALLGPSHNPQRQNLGEAVGPGQTVGDTDVAVEPTWTYSRRVSPESAASASGTQLRPIPLHTPRYCMTSLLSRSCVAAPEWRMRPLSII